MSIPLAEPEVTAADMQAVLEVLRSGRLSMGPRLAAFEEGCAEYLGAPHAVAVSSGTCALEIGLRALGIGPGDEVVTPSFSFFASAGAVLQVGARPVFVDIDPERLALDPARVEAALTPQTRAILAVHVFGCPAPMGAIAAIAARHGLLVVEDAAEALGAEIDGRKAGTVGDAGIFAFYPNKQITTGEGGMVVTRQSAVAERVRRLRNQGRDSAAGWLDHVELGHSYRLSELHCALGASQLGRIEAILRRREEIAEAYRQRLAAVAGLELPVPRVADGRIAWFTYVVRLAEPSGRADRDRVVAELAALEIECGRYFAPIHLQPASRELLGPPRHALPVTESVADRSLALPFFHRIVPSQIDRVCAALAASVAARPARGGT